MADVTRSLGFESHEVRVRLDAAGDCWWILTDVCAALDLTNPSQAAQRLAEDEKGLCKYPTPGGPQELLMVNESGLYRLIFRSDKPVAESFRRWVLHEVIPSLRKTGRYEVQESLPAPCREHAEVSEHLIRVWTALRDSEDWLSNHELAHRTAMSARTVRAHTKYLLGLGLLDLLETFPRHLYRLSPAAPKRNQAAYQRLELIAGVVASRQPRLPQLG